MVHRGLAFWMRTTWISLFVWVAAAWGELGTLSAQWLGLTYAVDTAFYAPLPLPESIPGSPGAAFDGSGLLQGNTSFWIYAHFSSPADRLQAVYALNSGNSISPPWTVEAPCGCFEHPYGSSVWNNTEWPFSSLFPELAYDSYFTIDHHPGTSIAGTLPLINGPSNLPAICNVNLEDVAMYVLGGVAAGSDLRIPIAHITTCGAIDFQACFQVSQALLGGQVQNVCSSVATGAPLHIDPPCTDYAQMTTSVEVNALLPGTPVTFDDNGAGADPLEVTLFDAEAGAWLSGTWTGPQVVGLPPGTYWAAIKDAETCRDTTDVFCIPPPFSQCGGGCINDGDGDGICDELEVPGCGDPDACNYEPAFTDFVPCWYPEPGYDCAGECLSDGDSDGVCDPFEIAGCMDSDACNFQPEATDDDGSCTFLATSFIAGPNFSQVGLTETYAYSAPPEHLLVWEVTAGGEIVGASNGPSVAVLWTTSGWGELTVVESNDTCTAAPVALPVEVEATNGAAEENPQWAWRWTPGPGTHEITLLPPSDSGSWTWWLWDLTGRCWSTGRASEGVQSVVSLPDSGPQWTLLGVESQRGERFRLRIPPMIR